MLIPPDGRLSTHTGRCNSQKAAVRRLGSGRSTLRSSGTTKGHFRPKRIDDEMSRQRTRSVCMQRVAISIPGTSDAPTIALRSAHAPSKTKMAATTTCTALAGRQQHDSATWRQARQA
jgi:hypothetical protein